MSAAPQSPPYTRLGIPNRYRVRVPLAGLGLPGRAVTRHTVTRRAALRVAADELRAAWAAEVHFLPTATVRQYRKGRWVTVGRFQLPDLDGKMVTA